MQGSKLSQVGKALQQINEKATGTTTRLNELTTRLGTLEGRTKGFEQIEGRVQTLVQAVAQAEQTAEKLLAPDGELQKHRHAVQQLSSQALQTNANLDALKKEQATLDQLRDHLRKGQAEVKGAEDHTLKLKGDIDRLRSLGGQLHEEYGKIKEGLRETREDANATTQAVKDVEKKLVPLATLNELSQSSEERLAALNVLAEHVSQKIKVLENQKHTVEHAVVEGNRLSEMVWNMDVQIAKLNDGGRQATQIDEVVQRIEKLAQDSAVQLESALKHKAAFAEDVTKLERDRTQLGDFMRGYLERLTMERKTLDAFDQRAQVVQSTLAAVEKTVDGLGATDRSVGGLNQKVDGLNKQMTGLLSQADELQKKQAALDSLQERLAQVDELSKRTAWQFDNLKQSRQDLTVLRKEIQEFYKSQTEISQVRDKIAADRTAFEGFLERVGEFKRHMLELDSRMDAITGKFSVVDEGTQKAANLVAIADDLDGQMTRIASHQQFAEKIEARLNTLNTLSAGVDRKLEEQLGRRADVESLKSLCDGLSLQVSDAQQKIDAVGAVQHKLLPITAQVAVLKGQIDKTAAAFKAGQQDEAKITAQETRLAELLDASRAVAVEVGDRVKQIEGLSAELGRSSVVKDELVEELSRAQGRQRDVAAQMEGSEDQLKRLEDQFKELDQRRSQVVFAERKVTAFEGRLGELRTMVEEVERNIQAIGAREAFVGTVKKEVAAIHEISARNKADLQHVTQHRGEVVALKASVDAVLKGIGETEERIAVIEARKKLVDEVQLKTNVISNMLADVRANLESLSEQKSVIDHVVGNLSLLNEMSQGAQATLKALQTERELAERIERGIKQVRAKTGGASEVQRSA